MILKKAYIRDLVNSSLINFIFKFCHFKNDGKILVKSMDGIGDILVKSGLFKRIIEKYGDDNVYFLLKKQYEELGNILGVNSIGIPRKSEKKFFKRLKMMYDINKTYSPKKFFNTEFGNDSTVANICAKERVGLEDNYELVRRYNKFYTRTFNFKRRDTKVLNLIKEIGEGILEEKLEIEDIIPDLRDKFTIEESVIVVAVGSSTRDRVCSPLRMKEYLLEVNRKLPDKEIILLGNGKLQKKYAQDLIKLLPNLNLKDLVDKTSLKEAFEIIAKSKLFIGFESGLYNFCFVARKKGIGLFRDTNIAFAHEVKWLKNIEPDSEKIDDFYDKEYPNEKINNISIEKFKRGLEELL